ncbi:hypothetical protein CU102_25085 [Phyllobacterium brassicacearum]|uniref:Uncharacterized protein n=1 Tax=Phyllobacterium brassicacearum TaxID=314235 RepID=A0A2P7B845_9HYPH|nr:hypothetical protein CU102_25085 [Phyllobacterium brassicacearum]
MLGFAGSIPPIALRLPFGFIGRHARDTIFSFSFERIGLRRCSASDCCSLDDLAITFFLD